MSRKIRSYTELSQIGKFEDRYEYLRVNAGVGVGTFGFERWLNQGFYQSTQWKQVRQQVIARDLGCDLGIVGHEIHDRIIVHHMNSVTVQDITHANIDILDPEYLITTTHRTHNAIHYGDKTLLIQPLVRRRAGDTKLW